MSSQYFKIFNFSHYNQRKCIKKWLRYRENCKSVSFHVYDLQINYSLICKLIRLLKYDPWKEPMMCKKNVSVAFWRRSNYTHDFRNNFSKKRWQNLSAKTVFSTFCIYLSMLSSLTFLLKNIAFLFVQGLSKISFHR